MSHSPTWQYWLNSNSNNYKHTSWAFYVIFLIGVQEYIYILHKSVCRSSAMGSVTKGENNKQEEWKWNNVKSSLHKSWLFHSSSSHYRQSIGTCHSSVGFLLLGCPNWSRGWLSGPNLELSTKGPDPQSRRAIWDIRNQLGTDDWWISSYSWPQISLSRACSHMLRMSLRRWL